MERSLVILNPTAGKLRGARRIDAIVSALSARSSVDVFQTRRPLDAAEKAFDSAGKYDVIIAVGGDGTLNEVISGLMKHDRRPELGYIPCGSTNDFAASIPLPLDPVRCAAGISLGGAVPIDIGRFDAESNTSSTRYFSYIASCGAFTDSSYLTPQRLKNKLGHQAYVLDALRRLEIPEALELTVQTENKKYEGRFIFCAVCNTTSAGRIIRLPRSKVRLNDGRFELLMIREPETPAHYISIASEILASRFADENIIFTKTADISVSSGTSISWSLDGERADCGEGTVRIRNEKRALLLRT